MVYYFANFSCDNEEAKLSSSWVIDRWEPEAPDLKIDPAKEAVSVFVCISTPS